MREPRRPRHARTRDLPRNLRRPRRRRDPPRQRTTALATRADALAAARRALPRHPKVHRIREQLDTLRKTPRSKNGRRARFASRNSSARGVSTKRSNSPKSCLVASRKARKRKRSSCFCRASEISRRTMKQRTRLLLQPPATSSASVSPRARSRCSNPHAPIFLPRHLDLDPHRAVLDPHGALRRVARLRLRPRVRRETIESSDAFPRSFRQPSPRRTRRPKRPRLIFVAHTDHPGFIARRMLDERTLQADFRGGVTSSFAEGAKIRFFADGDDRGVVGTVLKTSPSKERKTSLGRRDDPCSVAHRTRHARHVRPGCRPHPRGEVLLARLR